MSWSHEQTSLLIEEYQKHPCLYVVKSKDYHNKNCRNLALQKIVKVLSVIKPKVTEAEVQKKFQGLRTTYTTERKKVLDSMHSGMSSDEIYHPGLWYYDKMEFLNEHLTIRASKASFDVPSEVEEDTPIEYSDVEFLEKPFEGDYDMMDDGSLIMSPTELSESSVSRPLSRSMSPVARPKLSQLPSARITSPVAGQSGMKRKFTDSQPKKNKKNDADMILLGEVSKNLSSLGELMKPNTAPITETKTAEDTFGDFVAIQLKKIKDFDVRNEVQFQIHALLRDALKTNK